MNYSVGVTVSDNIRAAYGADESILNNHLENIGNALRMLQQSMLGRNIADASGLRLHIHLLTDENYVNGKFDPWHDEGNGTNHRLSQCSERCK